VPSAAGGRTESPPEEPHGAEPERDATRDASGEAGRSAPLAATDTGPAEIAPPAASPPLDGLPAVGGDGPSPEEIDRVYRHYLAAMGLTSGEYRLTPKRRTKIRTRLTEFDAGVLCDAIDQCRASPFHMGDDPKSPRAYNDLAENILKSEEKVEWWIRGGNGNGETH
jgi:hypothetical protein